MTDIVERLEFVGMPLADKAAKEIESLRARVAELENHSKSALVRFAECNGYDEADPIERLRFYCSLAMTGRNWLDVEQFFDALKASQGEPVATVEETRIVERINLPVGTDLYTSAPTIPNGWKLLRACKEAMLVDMRDRINTNGCDWSHMIKAIDEVMLAAAPEYKGEE